MTVQITIAQTLAFLDLMIPFVTTISISIREIKPLDGHLNSFD